jgi:hypothetical protein
MKKFFLGLMGVCSATLCLAHNGPSTQSNSTLLPFTQTPYGGTSSLIPGIIQAENYDLGGQGVAYNDLSLGNQGAVYRTDNVDVERISPLSGYHLAYIQNGEWVEYTVHATSTGVYSITAQVSALAAGKTFRLEMDGVTIANFTLPRTGEWKAFVPVRIGRVHLNEGTKTMRIVATSSDFNIDQISFELDTQGPHLGSSGPIPGTIQAEDYDIGGRHVAYWDLSLGNNGNVYRTEDVDVEQISPNPGYHLAWIQNGEWLEYTVDVASPGTYNVTARVSALAVGKSFRLEMDGVTIANFAVPNTGGWLNWQSVQVSGVTLGAGTKVMRIVATNSDFNIDQISFALTSPSSARSASTNKAFAEKVIDNNGIRLFPNPAQDMVTIDFGGERSPVTVEVYGINGKLMLVKPMHPAKPQLDVSSLPAGQYVVKVRTSQDKATITKLTKG